MKIAYLTQSYPPMISGAALSAQQTAEGMAKRGHQVLVIAASDREYPYHSYKDRLTVLRLSSFKNPLRVGQRFLSFPQQRTMRVLAQFQPDLLHAHEPVQMGLLALKYASRAHIPATITAHQLPWFVASYLPAGSKPVVEYVLWLFARLTLRRYTSVIAPTKTIASIIEKMTGLKPDIIGNGLDLQTFHPRPPLDPGTAVRTQLNLPESVPIILHVGRLDADKSVDKVIRAVAPVVRESEAHLLVVGDGRQKNRLIQFCKILGIEKKVHFAGFIQPADLPGVYRMANMFVTASEIETQGIVLLEAAASGLPIVAFDTTCIHEIVRNRVNGFLIGPGNIQAFSNAIIALLNDPQTAARMGAKGCKLAQEHDIRNTWEMHENLYQEVIKNFRFTGQRLRTRTSGKWNRELSRRRVGGA
ncbi:MAG: hypothetical protein C3F07_19735 [Anaerolineales bacterium]|nr:MAG: hypothetical protein C3F07_19735 [Anaerolineales bacterium]